MKRIEKQVSRHPILIRMPNLRANHQAATHATSAVILSFGYNISRVIRRSRGLLLPMATSTQGREDHRETCNPPDDRQAGIEASQVG